MIVVTGAAGFIASVLVGELNRTGFRDLILVDDFSRIDKAPNHETKIFRDRIHRDRFAEWLENNGRDVDFVFHLGARTDTTEFSVEVFDRLNLDYSKEVFRLCANHQIPLLYASSAATYGDGALGFKDDHSIVNQLSPLNPYGRSKNDFDKWVLSQE
jgi:ADP-L-glycero-D-manno-heptose 6-epimerase